MTNQLTYVSSLNHTAVLKISFSFPLCRSASAVNESEFVALLLPVRITGKQDSFSNNVKQHSN
jgi:hypothetical protein